MVVISLDINGLAEFFRQTCDSRWPEPKALNTRAPTGTSDPSPRGALEPTAEGRARAVPPISKRDIFCRRQDATLVALSYESDTLMAKQIAGSCKLYRLGGKPKTNQKQT